MRPLIVIPAKNEDTTVAEVIRGSQRYGDVLVVDDYSTDDTLDLSLDLGATVISNEIGGYSGAIYSGIEFGIKNKYKFIVTIDGDGEHWCDDIPKIVQKLQSGADVVFGIRPKTQRFSETIYNKYYQFIFSLKTDYCSGLKGYNTTPLINKNPKYKDICGNIHAFRILRMPKTTSESVPITIIPRQVKTRFGGIIVGNIKIFRSIFKAMLG